MSSMVKVLLAVAFSGICTGLSYSQSITFDPGYPKYVNTGFPFYTKKIEILGTFTVPAGYSLVADVQIMYTIGGVNSTLPTPAKVLASSGKFGTYQGGVIVPYSFTAPATGTYPITATGSYFPPGAMLPTNIPTVKNVTVP